VEKSFDQGIAGALGIALGTLGQASSLLLVGSTIAYGVGWRAASSYYSEFGADWVVSDLRPSELIAFSAVFGGTFSLTALSNMASLSTGATSEAFVRRAALFLYLSAAFFWLASGNSWRLFGVDSDSLTAFLSAVLYSVGLGFSAAEFVARLRSTKLKWDGGHFWIVYVAALGALTQAPVALGKARAADDLHPVSSSLPKVVLDPAESHDWRLLRNGTTGLILVALDSASGYPALRIVDPKQVKEIRSQPRAPRSDEPRATGKANLSEMPRGCS
jgi:hypothetical protein